MYSRSKRKQQVRYSTRNFLWQMRDFDSPCPPEIYLPSRWKYSPIFESNYLFALQWTVAPMYADVQAQLGRVCFPRLLPSVQISKFFPVLVTWCKSRELFTWNFVLSCAYASEEDSPVHQRFFLFLFSMNFASSARKSAPTPTLLC